MPVLADKFGISRTYFSEYFKKHVGDSLRANYIIKSKLRLAETKIAHTDLSLNLKNAVGNYEMYEKARNDFVIDCLPKSYKRDTTKPKLKILRHFGAWSISRNLATFRSL